MFSRMGRVADTPIRWVRWTGNSERAVLDLAGELAAHRARKADIGWPLALLETAARAAANDDDANTAPPSM